MGFLKAKTDYVQRGDAAFKPGPKYGHLSQPHPQAASIFSPMEEGMLAVWNSDMSMAELKELFRTAPPALPEGCPEPGRDVAITYEKVRVRDGAEVEVKIWKSTTPRKNSALVLRMHGGGWTVGAHESEEAENRYLGALPNVVVVSVDYRMAPEFPFPYALNDSFDVLKWCKLNASLLGINTEKIIVAGCSAGGNLAATVAIMARDEGVTGIVGQVLSIPVMCHPKFFDRVPNKDEHELLSYTQNFDVPLVDALRMEFFWDCYVGADVRPDVLHSPLLSTNLRNLPPAVVLVAGMDPLRDEGIAYAHALRAAGVTADVHTYKGLPHGFYCAVGLPETAEYMKRVVDFVQKCAARDSRL